MNRYRDATYEGYVANQIDGNRRKIDRVWVIEENVRFIAEKIISVYCAPIGVRFGICHGTRRGAEQALFRKMIPGCEVVGTEISPTALLFPDTIQWDFHLPRAEWIGRADFVYTNSHDHARNPERAVQVWLAQLRPGGVLVLEHTDYHEQLTDYNCWAVTEIELAELLALWSGGKRVRSFDLPVRHSYLSYCRAVVVTA
jgi:hypothetical protein